MNLSRRTEMLLGDEGRKNKVGKIDSPIPSAVTPSTVIQEWSFSLTTQPSALQMRNALSFLKSEPEVAPELRWNQEFGTSPYCSLGIGTGCNHMPMGFLPLAQGWHPRNRSKFQMSTIEKAPTSWFHHNLRYKSVSLLSNAKENVWSPLFVFYILLIVQFPLQGLTWLVLILSKIAIFT